MLNVPTKQKKDQNNKRTRLEIAKDQKLDDHRSISHSLLAS